MEKSPWIVPKLSLLQIKVSAFDMFYKHKLKKNTIGHFMETLSWQSSTWAGQPAMQEGSCSSWGNLPFSPVLMRIWEAAEPHSTSRGSQDLWVHALITNIPTEPPSLRAWLSPLHTPPEVFVALTLLLTGRDNSLRSTHCLAQEGPKLIMLDRLTSCIQVFTTFPILIKEWPCVKV